MPIVLSLVLSTVSIADAEKKSSGIRKGTKSVTTKKKTFVPKRRSPVKKKNVQKKSIRKKKTVRSKRKNTKKQMASAQNDVATARLETMRNRVEYKSSRGKSWRKATKKTQFRKDDVVRTGSRSLARVKLNDGSRILLLQNSEAELENISSVGKAIKLLRGRVRAIVKRLKTSRTFKIKTPIGVASVRGTDFTVEHSDVTNKTKVSVASGSVEVYKEGIKGEAKILNAGQSLEFDLQSELKDPVQTGAAPVNSQDVRQEVVNTKVKNRVLAQAAEELRNADYQVGKSLIDVDGRRVRVEEYITRPASNQFKLVALNHRKTRFDYFTYTGTFFADLPSDLSLALRNVNGSLGATAPSNYMTGYEMFMSNTVDSISDVGTGGHLVKITFNESTGKYTLDDGVGNTRDVDRSVQLNDGTYKIYNPVTDTFSLVSAANRSNAEKFSVLDNGVRRNFTATDTVWRTRYNNNEFRINGTVKSSYAPKTGVTNVLALDLDADFTNPAVTSASEFPSGSTKLHNRLSLFYSDGSKLVYDNYIINDEGVIADTSLFSGLSGSAEYKNQLDNFNYQTKIKADEMSDFINLVIDPRIGTISGLIQ